MTLNLFNLPEIQPGGGQITISKDLPGKISEELFFQLRKADPLLEA